MGEKQASQEGMFISKPCEIPLLVIPILETINDFIISVAETFHRCIYRRGRRLLHICYLGGSDNPF
jgi:hypothetical protein